MQVFHWHVWLALGLTSVGVGILISCLESLRRAAIQRHMAAAGRGADMGSSSTRASAPVVQHGKGVHAMLCCAVHMGKQGVCAVGL